MEKQDRQKHFYILPDGNIVESQMEGRIKLGIGRNAFRNRVKSGVIKKIITNDKPQGFYEEETYSTVRKN